MTHYRKLMPPGEFLGPQDFEAPREVTISRVAIANMPERDGKVEQACCMWIMQKDGAEYPRRLKLPKTVLFAFSLVLGTDSDAWTGQKITLKAAWCLSFGELEECVRPVLTAEQTALVIKRLKKRKTNSKVWECEGPK
jgi:hypothetical protein